MAIRVAFNFNSNVARGYCMELVLCKHDPYIGSFLADIEYWFLSVKNERLVG